MWWWKQSIHSSFIVALGSAGFVVGVACSLVYQPSFVAGVVGACIVIGAFVWRRRFVLPFVAIGALFTGLSYGAAHLGERQLYQDIIGKTVKVSGRVREDPSRAASGSISLQLESVRINNTPLAGVVFVSVRSVRDVKRGDYVSGVGEARDGFGQFPVSFSLVSLDGVERSPFGDVGRVVRDWFAEHVRVVIPEPAASLGIGFLTGQKSALPPDLSEALKIAGLTHIVVASGYNLTILVRVARRLLLKISKYLSVVSAGVMIVGFMAITGLSPSMTRAGLVSGLSLLAYYYGHVFHPFVLLPFAAAITVALQPSYVWGDLGWQLSFSAFCGVMIVAPLLHAYFFGSSEPSTMRQILGETLAAHIVTVPIIALSFGAVSNVAIIANLLVVPLVPLAMLLTFVCGVGVIVGVPFVEMIALPTTWLLDYMVYVAEYVAELPWAQHEITAQGWLWVGYAALLAGMCYWMWRASGYRFSGVREPPLI